MSVEIVFDPGATWKANTARESMARMYDLVDVAAAAGADTFKPQYLRSGMYRTGTAAAALVTPYMLPWHWLAGIKKRCSDRGLGFLITPYRAEDVAELDQYVDRWKIASFDAGNKDLLRAVIATGKPILVSLGLGQNRSLAFLDAFERTTALHCVSAYPTPDEQMNLGRMRQMTGRHGLSDHSIGHHAAVMAVALGATVIERHIRHWGTPPDNPDYAAAADPEAAAEYVAAIRQAERLLGDGVHRVQPAELVAYRFDPTTGRRGGE